jgi:hypothetical protein
MGIGKGIGERISETTCMGHEAGKGSDGGPEFTLITLFETGARSLVALQPLSSYLFSLQWFIVELSRKKSVLQKRYQRLVE